MERCSTRNYENAAADPSAASARADSGRDDSVWGTLRGSRRIFRADCSTPLRSVGMTARWWIEIREWHEFPRQKQRQAEVGCASDPENLKNGTWTGCLRG